MSIQEVKTLSAYRTRYQKLCFKIFSLQIFFNVRFEHIPINPKKNTTQKSAPRGNKKIRPNGAVHFVYIREIKEVNTTILRYLKYFYVQDPAVLYPA